MDAGFSCAKQHATVFKRGIDASRPKLQSSFVSSANFSTLCKKELKRGGLKLEVKAKTESNVNEGAVSSNAGEFLTIAQWNSDSRLAFEGSQFTKSLADMYPRKPCRSCGGVGHVGCEQCEGKGMLRKGGYHKRNPVTITRIVGSRWTAMERTFGWRHFEVNSKVKLNGKDWFLEMVATCDSKSRFWVNANNLKDRERWSMGWLQKAEIEETHRELSMGSLVCKACRGMKIVPCTTCFTADDSDSESLALDLDIIEV